MRIVNRSCDLEKASFSSTVAPLLQRIYQARGFNSDADLSLQLSRLPKPDLMLGVDKAVELLIDALNSKQRIVIVGDFDADGATSSALMVLALSAMGFESVEFLVPNRFDYGYGLTPEIVELAQNKSPHSSSLSIMVSPVLKG